MAPSAPSTHARLALERSTHAPADVVFQAFRQGVPIVPVLERLAAGAPDWLHAVSDAGHTAVSMAAYLGRADVVRWALAQGVSPNAGTDATAPSNALRVAMSLLRLTGGSDAPRDSDGEIVAALLAGYAYSDDEKAVGLAWAAAAGSVDGARALLDGGAPVRLVSSVAFGDQAPAAGAPSQLNPLSLAIQGARTEAVTDAIVALMLQDGRAAAVLDVGWGDAFQGRSPLHAAAAVGTLSVMGRLLAAGAAVNPPEGFQDRPLDTPLMAAATRGHLAIVSALLEAGANAHVLDGAGRHALHLWAGAELPDDRRIDAPIVALTQALIDAGADPLLPDREGDTPLAIAQAQPSPHPGVVRVLRAVVLADRLARALPQGAEGGAPVPRGPRL